MAKDLFEVHLTHGAERDLESSFDYLTENGSAEQAAALLGSFLSKVQTLERYPSRGSIPKELDALGIREFRQVLLQPYRIIYRITDDKVFVMIIADGRRDMQTLLQQRLLGTGM